MTISAAIHHVTHYNYDRPVVLQPAGHPAAPCAALPHAESPRYSLKIDAGRHFINWQQDPHGNYLARVVFPEKATIRDRGRSDRRDGGHQSVRLLPGALRREIPLRLSSRLAELAPYLEPSRRPAARRLSTACAPGAQRTIDFLVELNKRVSEATIRYLIRHGAGRADARGDAGARLRLLPRHRPGCWCRSCAGSASPRASSRAI